MSRTTSGGGPDHRLRTVLRGPAWVAGSFAVFYLLFFDPLDAHPADSWLQRAFGYYLGAGTADGPSALERAGLSSSERAASEILFYRNPMDPTITSPVPAKDSMGMDYVPVYADEAAGAIGAGSTVVVHPVTVQNMNVRTQRVERGDLRQEIRTVGYLEYDQDRMVTVTTKYSGWVEQVYVNHVGQPVAKGDPLFEVYSPELVQTEQELLAAIRYAERLAEAPEADRRRAEALVTAARSRLAFWDISEEQVRRLEETGAVFRTLTVTAPASGLVMRRMAGLEGMAVTPGLEAFHIADIASLWLSVEVFEDQVRSIRPGAEARIVFDYFPGETTRGTVQFIEPELSERTRTLTMKVAVPNPDGRLRAGMFATVVFDPVLVEGAVLAPSEAVLRTGRRTVAIAALGAGRFEAREIEIGRSSQGLVEVRSGLAPGDMVVVSSQFLLDSESRLQEAVQRMLTAAPSSAAHVHPGSDEAPDAPADEMDHSAHGADEGPRDHLDHGDHAEHLLEGGRGGGHGD